eukprot:scaffold88130_cov15-Tisochrysis_lutea.AAC.1
MEEGEDQYKCFLGGGRISGGFDDCRVLRASVVCIYFNLVHKTCYYTALFACTASKQELINHIFTRFLLLPLAVAALCYPLASYMFRRSWRAKSASEVARFTSLRLFLMQHLGVGEGAGGISNKLSAHDLDDIRASLESIRGQ